MPWFPEFVAAMELARRQTRAAGRADPVHQYLVALSEGDARTLETAWPGELVVHDPRAGEVRGHRQLRRFVGRSEAWLAERQARVETVASTCTKGRAVVELLAYLTSDGAELAWPVAVVAESPDDSSVMFRSYCSQWPVDGRRHLRSPVLGPGDEHPGDVVGRYQAALQRGDTDAVIGSFGPEGYYSEAFAPNVVHRGTTELRTFFIRQFSAGGGVDLQHCAVTDDGVRCALEYNCVGWGRRDLPPQAGLGVHERGPDGLLTAVRVYDDIEPPV
jgi:limonene-1,2-epoxide hydrolase